MHTDKIKEGNTYWSSVAIWTVDHISPGGMVFVIRDDGRTTQFGLATFANMVVAEVAPTASRK